MYGATASGSAICPGVGTVVGFVVGGVVCIVVDIFASNLLDDLIEKKQNRRVKNEKENNSVL